MAMNMQIISAFLYGISSLLIIIANKIVLTTYKFPSALMLGVGQMLVTVISMYSARKLGVIEFQQWSMTIFFKIFPLPLFYFGNLVFGLVGTGAVSLPMFTVLRRFTNLFILIAEAVCFRKRIKADVLICVLIMILGAIVAAVYDLSFDFAGYVYIFLNNICTMANGIALKMKLNAKDLNKYALLHYNALIMLPPACIFAHLTGEATRVWHFDQWANFSFLFAFFISCLFGVFLLYCTALCTQHNSALTTGVIGVIKNISVAYLGMFIGNDYTFSWLNFLGLNISALGAAFYAYVTFSKSSTPTSAADLTKVVTVRESSGRPH